MSVSLSLSLSLYLFIYFPEKSGKVGDKRNKHLTICMLHTGVHNERCKALSTIISDSHDYKAKPDCKSTQSREIVPSGGDRSEDGGRHARL